ncbi:MAG: GGDEF domain-containing protein [Deltaproteobacteria bacterium]|nr:GGDEF domain-containing protein [Deltaproteobacteria bacterium]
MQDNNSRPKFSLSGWKDVSLRLKLLGIYFFGLSLLGMVGYGFFIYQEIKNLEQDRKILHYQARHFEKMAFEHLQYARNLKDHLSTVYLGADCGNVKCEKSKIVNDFLKSIAALGNRNFTFAIFDYFGNLVISNDRVIRNLKTITAENRKIILDLISKTNRQEIYSEYVRLRDENGAEHGFYVNSVIFEPLKYYIMAIAGDLNIENCIANAMQDKRRIVFSSIFFSILLGLFCTSLLLGFLYLYLRSLAGNITEITKSISRLASGEQSETRLVPRNQDEIGRLITVFNLYVRRKIELEHFKKLIEEDESITDVYKRIFVMLHNFGISDFALYEVKNSKNHLHYIHPETVGNEDDNQFVMPCSQEILLNADFCRAKRLAHEIRGDRNYQVCSRYQYYQEGCHHVCIPIIISGTVGEVVHITIQPSDFERINTQIPVIMDYFRNAAPVIESKKLLANLKDATLRDSLTGLNNRRFLEGYVEMLVAEVEREKKNVAILMADLDYFKKVNDVYGHQVGDRVLQTLARILRNAVRSSDIVIRYGGEEFLLILKNIDTEDDAMTIAEKIREDVEQHTMKIDDAITLKKTLTIGVSLFPEDSETFWQAVKFADVALYNGKNAGRNRVVRFAAAMWNDEEY